MRRTPWATYLWPGLPQVWSDGTFSGLLLAIGCGLLLDILLLGHFAWVDLLGGWLLALGWTALAGVWVSTAVLVFRRRRPEIAAAARASADSLLRQAQTHYLQGHWFETETTLNELLEGYVADVEARLLLCTLLRRTRRHKEAREQLSRLDHMDGAAAWQPELEVERELLAKDTPSLTNVVAEKLAGAVLGPTSQAA